MCCMDGCVFNFVSVCLTLLLASAAPHDTELGVAGCQLLLSYRDTQCYNKRARAWVSLTLLAEVTNFNSVLLTARTATSHLQKPS